MWTLNTRTEDMASEPRQFEDAANTLPCPRCVWQTLKYEGRYGGCFRSHGTGTIGCSRDVFEDAASNIPRVRYRFWKIWELVALGRANSKHQWYDWPLFGDVARNTVRARGSSSEVSNLVAALAEDMISYPSTFGDSGNTVMSREDLRLERLSQV
jgi:hypothetical protein